MADDQNKEPAPKAEANKEPTPKSAPKRTPKKDDRGQKVTFGGVSMFIKG